MKDRPACGWSLCRYRKCPNSGLPSRAPGCRRPARHTHGRRRHSNPPKAWCPGRHGAPPSRHPEALRTCPRSPRDKPDGCGLPPASADGAWSRPGRCNGTGKRWQSRRYRGHTAHTAAHEGGISHKRSASILAIAGARCRFAPHAGGQSVGGGGWPHPAPATRSPVAAHRPMRKGCTTAGRARGKRLLYYDISLQDSDYQIKDLKFPCAKIEENGNKCIFAAMFSMF